jgi:hypothetical protein
MPKDTATPETGNGTDLNSEAAVADRLDGIEGLFGDEFDDEEDDAAPTPRRESKKGGKQDEGEDEEDDDLSDDEEDDEESDDDLLGDEDEDTDDDEQDEEEDEDTDDVVPDSEKPAGKSVQPAPESLHEVTLPGGEKAKVPYTELVKGYSREADYTRKTMALAEKDAQYSTLI